MIAALEVSFLAKRSRAVPHASQSGTPKLFLDSFLPYQLRALADQVSRITSQIYGDGFNLSRPEWRVLASLVELGPVFATDICAHSTQDKMTVSRAIANLESKNLLVRRDAAQDRRNKRLELTQAGQILYQQIVPLILAREACLLEVFSQAERATLQDLLTRLKQRAEELSK